MYRPILLMLALVASPALAGHYHADPAAKPMAPKLVIRDTLWSCGNSGCTAGGPGSSRPAIVCELLVREVGALRSFSAAGRPFSPEQLQKCNARAQ